MAPQLRLRLRLVAGGLIFITFVLVITIYYVQVVKAEVYTERGDRQYTRSTNVFDRGDIYFSEKGGTLIAAATVKSGYILALTPSAVVNPEETFTKLSSVASLDQASFFEKAARTQDPYEEIARKLSQDQADRITALKLPGVHIYKMRWRFYPGNTLGAQTLGLVSFKDNILTGQYGIERYYNDVLSRTDEDAYVNFFAQAFSTINKSLAEKKYGGEGDVVLSLEPAVQSYLDEELQKIQNKYSSQLTGGIIINPMNGEIVAMGVVPSFDLNNFSQEKDPMVFSNPLVEGVYEMGSIIKPLTMAAGIDVGAVSASSTYFDQGFLVLNNSKISNFDGKGRGLTTMQEVLSQSLNTGVAHVVEVMGKDAFRDYMKNYGLGEETGIDLPNEAHGLVKNLDSPRDIELATASYGQGIALTPIGTVRALSALGNGGYLITPHLVKRIDYSVGISKEVTYEPDRQVIKKETSEQITKMLVQVVDKALLKGEVKMDHYSVAAKTGTGLLAKQGGGGYYEDRYLHSFFGYFPAYQPKFLVFIYTLDPKGVDYASHTLTYPFSNVVKFLINYYQIPPDR